MSARRGDLGAVAVLALAVRIPWLGSFPGVAGDEANWALYAHAAARGERVRLTADAAFVTELYAWILAPAARLGGLSWAALRAVNVAAVALACVAVCALGARVAGRRAGLACAAVMALHPWSVMWSRTVSVPYALAVACLALGSLALLDAHGRRGRAMAVAGWQALGLSLHFTPLGAPVIAAALVATARARWRPWSAVALGCAHGLFIARGALGVARSTPSTGAVPFATGVARAARAVAAQLDGVSTVRHVAGASAAFELAGLVALAALAAGAWQARGDLRVRRAAALCGLCAVSLPLLLVPARSWSMPTIDADRYGVAVVAPLALLLGAMASSTAPARLAAWAFVGWIALGPTLFLARHAWRGGGGDLGLEVARGGGRYRGWQRVAGGGVLVDRAYDAALRDARGAPAVIAYQDYALHAIRARTLTERASVRHRFGEPDARPGERAYWLLWSDRAFAPTYAPRAAADAQNALHRRVIDSGAARVDAWATPDGTPLAELWAAR